MMPDPNRTAIEIHLETPRWVKWLKARSGFVLLCSLTVGLYFYFENQIELAWWGVVIAYLIFVLIVIAGFRFLHSCDEEIERMR